MIGEIASCSDYASGLLANGYLLEAAGLVDVMRKDVETVMEILAELGRQVGTLRCMEALTFMSRSHERSDSAVGGTRGRAAAAEDGKDRKRNTKRGIRKARR